MTGSLLASIALFCWFGCGVCAVVILAKRRGRLFEGLLSTLGLAIAAIALGPIALYSALTEIGGEM